MSTLLVQGCSKSKNQVTEPVPPLELYSGFFFKILKKARRSGEFGDDIEVVVLSAEYGLVDSETAIEPYDRKMDRQRARELAPSVSESLFDQLTEGIDRVVLNLGKTYQLAVEEFARDVALPVEAIDGGGIGEKGHALKRFVRGDDSVLSDFQPKPLSTGN